MSKAVGQYRAKVNCRAGGLFRRAGEEFAMPALDVVPDHLEEIGVVGSGKVEAKSGKPASVPKAAQVSATDIGVGPGTPVQDVAGK